MKARSGEWEGKDLRGISFRGADLSHARLRGADLSQADLAGADLSDANLSGACLAGANLREAIARSADFSEADLTGVLADRGSFLDCDFVKAVFDGADWTQATVVRSRWRHGRGRSADFSEAKIEKSDFSHCDLTEAVFWCARIEDSLFIHTFLEGAVFDCSEQTRTTFLGSQPKAASYRNVKGPSLQSLSALEKDGAAVGLFSRAYADSNWARLVKLGSTVLILTIVIGFFLVRTFVPYAWNMEKLIRATWKALQNENFLLARNYIKVLDKKYYVTPGINHLNYLLEGRMAEKSGDGPKAKAAFRLALTTAEGNLNNYLEALFSLARAEMELKEFEQARRHAEELTRLADQKQFRQTHYPFAGLQIQAEVMLHQKRYVEAAGKMSPALDSENPEWADQAAQLVVDALTKQIESIEEPADLNKEIQSVMDQNPVAGHPRVRIGFQLVLMDSLSKAARWEEATERLKQLDTAGMTADDVPPNLEMLTQVANRFPEQPREEVQRIVREFYRNILALYERESRTDGRYHWVNVQLGNMFHAEGQDEKAMELWTRVAAESIDPYPRIHAREGMVNVLIQRKDYSEALALANKLKAEVATPHAAVMSTLLEARVRVAQGKAESALRMLNDEIKQCRDEWSCCMVLQNQLQILTEGDRVEELSALLRQAQERWPFCSVEIDRMKEQIRQHTH